MGNNVLSLAGNVATLVCALGCGGQAQSDERGPEPASAAPAGVPGRASLAPLPTMAPPAAGAAMGSRGPRTPRPSPPDGDTAYFPKDAAANVLLANCGSCHGPSAPAATSGGIRFIGDIDQLVATGLLVPLNSAASPVVQVMVKGSMPPPSSGLPPLTEADIGTITQYLDNPRFWPSALPPPAISSPATDAGAALPLVDAGVDGG